MFSFLTPYLTYVKVGIAVVLLGTIGTLYLMVDHYKATNKALTGQIAEVRSANTENVQTINAMKNDTSRAFSLCTVRLAEKDRVISALRNINSASQEVSHENVVFDSGDSFLNALNGLYSKAGYQGGVCKTGSPGAAPGGSGQSSDILYCFSSKQDAVNMLSNKILHDGREKDMEEILKSFQAK